MVKPTMCFVSTLAVVVMLAGLAAGSTVRIAERWGDSPTNGCVLGLLPAIKGFEEKYPDIHVEIVYGVTEDKAKLSIAAGEQPDIYVVWPAVSWGADGLLQPLDKYIEQSGVKRDTFVPAAWDQNLWDGKIWALPMKIDPNFALAWNRAKFAEVGLPPTKGPTTVKEFDLYFNRLTMYNSDGSPRQIGIVPWTVYGNANTIFTWGWIFGGDFYDIATGRVTAHHERNVKALEYLKDYWTRYNDMYMSLGQGLPSGQNRFLAGRQAMSFYVTGDYFLHKQRFRDFEFGFGPMPIDPESGVTNPAWIGGWSVGILTGAKNPDDAWKFIHYITADPEGASLFSQGSGWITANIKAPAFRNLGRDADWKVWTDIAITTERYRPAIPALSFYNTQLEKLLGPALNGSVTPRAGLEEVSRLVELEMQKYRK
ncbi:MAG TPA: extracellular solute-binding protein [Firmicutes bacterium]|nr:extracellular solute-binding protein [Bacillota bacterium]